MELILKARDLKPEFQYLNIRLQLERQRLWNWSEVSGLLSYLGGQMDALDSSLTGLNRHLILEVVLHIQTLVTEFVKVKGRYQGFLKNRGRIESLMKGQLEDLDKSVVESLDDDDSAEESDVIKRFPRSAEVVGRLVRSFEITQQLPKRLRWAMFDQGNFKGLLDRLKELNDCLIDLVDNSVRMQILTMTKETNINYLGLCNRVDDLSQLVQALARSNEPPSASTLDARLHSSHGQAYSRFQDEVNKELLDLSMFKTLLQSMDYEAVDSEQIKTSELDRKEITLLESKTTHFSSSEGFRCEALYRDQSVWIEWKDYQPMSYRSPVPDPRILSRVQKLAALLHTDPKPTAFRVPHCLGYFNDMKDYQQGREQGLGDDEESSSDEEPENFRFGFVFTKPPGINPSTAPISLHELLQRPSRPSLSSRIAVAQAIVNCVYYLHSVNWLHKGLRSHNIVFFPSSSDSAPPPYSTSASASTPAPAPPPETKKNNLKIDYATPYLSGFDYARPARREELTEAPPSNPDYDIYRHPDIQSSSSAFASAQGYKKSYDIYSLGVILVEIAAWVPISDLLDPEGSLKIVRSKVRERLLSEKEGFLENVDADMGGLYRESVRCCLQGGAALGIGEGAAALSAPREGAGALDEGANPNKEFYERVVKRLEQIKC